MGENFYATSPDKQKPLQNSNASSTDFIFESTTAEVPIRTTTPFRSAAEIDTDEPLDESRFAVYDGNGLKFKQIGNSDNKSKLQDNYPDWKDISNSYNSERIALHKRITNCLQELRGIEDAFEKNNAEFHKRVEKSYVQFSNELAGQQASLSEEQRNYEQEEDVMRKVHKLQNEKVTLNVGGSYFVTSSTTLTRDPYSMLAIMLQTEEPDPDGSYFLDRDSTYFRLILNFLRDLKVPQKAYEDHRIMDELMQEARYYRINDLLKLRWTNLPAITQEDLYRQYPVPTSNKQPTVFNLQHKNLAGLDFSRYHIDAKSSFSGSNLEACNFLNATFGFDFDNKINFSNAYLHKAKFPRPDGREDLVEEFNTDGAILDNSHHSI